jgi:hypothetical protein
MKIHLLEIDDTLTIFGVVSKKRTGHDGKNVVGINVYDLETGKEVKYQDIRGIVNIDRAREFWNTWIDYATSENHEIKRTELIYNSPNRRTIMMDSEIIDAMEEVVNIRLGI